MSATVERWSEDHVVSAARSPAVERHGDGGDAAVGKLHRLGQEPLQGLHRRRRTRVQVHMPQSQIPMQALRGPSVPVEQRRRRRGDSRRLRR